MSPPKAPSRLLRVVMAVTLCILGSSLALAAPQTNSGIDLDKDWKVSLYAFAKEEVQHPSWGLTHAERNFHVTRALADAEGIEIDEDVLFASAILHDLGGLEGHKEAGVDHAIQSAKLAKKILLDRGFPEDKWGAVNEVILGHTYYGAAPKMALARLFRDADILDFLGPLGAARLFAAGDELHPQPSLKNSFLVIQKLGQELPGKLLYNSSKTRAKTRAEKLQPFLKSLQKYSFDETAF